MKTSYSIAFGKRWYLLAGVVSILHFQSVTLLAQPCNGHDLPNASFMYSPNSLIYSGEDTVTFINTSSESNTYQWDFGDGTVDNVFSPSHVYKQPGTYIVHLRVINPSTLCENTTDKTIEVKGREEIYIPTGFTPNGDGLNDAFTIAVSHIAEIEIQVYNRLGEVIFSSHDPNTTWDGTYKGELMQMDAYNYVVAGKGTYGTSFTKSGSVVLLR
jgi:gliding motility-associated-like protein